MINTVWSDRSAALTAASSLGLEYELIEGGDDPVYAAVGGSDATLMFCTDESINAQWARRVCELCGVDTGLGGERKGKPLFVVEWDEHGKPKNPRYTQVSLADWVRRWLFKQRVSILYVMSGPDIEEWVVEFLMDTLDQEAWDEQARQEKW